MANNILTHQQIAREAAAMLIEEGGFLSNINTDRKEDIAKETAGYKSGDSVTVKIPPVPVVYDGNVFAEGGTAQGFQETSKTLRVSTQKHVGLAFSSIERVMEITQFKERILRPAIQTLGAVVQADMLKKTYKQIPGVIGTAGSLPSTLKTFNQAQARLNSNLCPGGMRTCLITSDQNVELVDESRKLFNPVADASKAFKQGIIGAAMGMDFYECLSVPLHTNGADVTGITVYGAGQSGSELDVDHVTEGATITAGSVFTIDGVYAVHPLTGESYGHLQQFVATANATGDASSNATITISPTIKATGPDKTVSALPGNGAALTFVGAASTGYRQNLAFHKDSIISAVVPLPIVQGCEGYTATVNGISLRVMTGGDFTNDAENTRIDVLYADPVVLRWGHAVRITQ